MSELLADGSHCHTRDLVKQLWARYGLEVRGSDKVLALSGLLSKDERFEANRSLGWSLKKAGP